LPPNNEVPEKDPHLNIEMRGTRSSNKMNAAGIAGNVTASGYTFAAA
jgi:hypothetical protein